MVISEAVNCRNYYVHGSERRFDYDGNFGAIVFFTDTLEFISSPQTSLRLAGM